MNYTFGTGAMRSGGALVLSILELNKKTITFCEIYYFSRHIFKKYKDLNNQKTKYKISYNFHLILKYRNKINIKLENIFEVLKRKKIKNYGDLYIILANILVQNNKFKNFVEYSNGEWRFINHFLKLNKKFKAFLIIRDPRSVIASFKKISHGSKYDYLNCIFNWIDSFDYLEKLKKKYNENRFLLLKFEDIHKDPENNTKKICKFLNISFKSSYIKNKNFKKIKNKSLTFSALSTKPSFGFDVSRNNQWMNNLTNWEIAIIEYLCRNRMKKLDYKFENFDKKELQKGIKKLNQNSLIKKRFRFFKNSNKGTNLRMNDPSKPENWSSQKNTLKKFINDNEYKNYITEIKKYEQNFKYMK
jgi:hypothetical protein